MLHNAGVRSGSIFVRFLVLYELELVSSGDKILPLPSVAKQLSLLP